MKSLDDRILIYIQDHIRNPVLDPVMIAVTNLGNGLWFVIGVYLWFSGENIPGGRYILISLLVSWILSKIFKVIFGRTRAYHAIPGLTTIVPEPKDKAFPSAHAATAFGGAFAVLFLYPGISGAASILFAVLISFSRMYVGVHYLTDLLGGAVTGAIGAAICLLIL